MLKAVITTFVLATSSAAVADTPYPYNHDRDDRYDESYNDRSDFDREWQEHQRDAHWRQRHSVLLANNVFVTSRSTRPTWVSLQDRYGLSKLQVQLQTGRTFVDNVVVVYSDNHRELLRVNRWLSPRDPAITVDITHRGLRGLIIDSRTPNRFARGGGVRRGQTATIDVVGIRR